MSVSNIPKLRFKEFGGEWEEKQLGELCKLKAGKFVSASEISEKQEFEMFPCYGGNGIRGYVKTQTHEGDYTLIGRQGALCGNVQFTSGKFHATEHAVVVSPNEENDSLWLYYQLDRLNLNRYATGQAQPGLSVDVIEKVKTSSPFKLEQQKIASFLSAVDTKINQFARKKELLVQYKKGVMQKILSQGLRFKAEDGSEFPEWEEKKLGEIAIFLKGSGISKDNISENGNLECIRYGELYTYYKETIHEAISKTNLDKNGLVLSQKNDIIIPSSGETAIDLATASCVLKDGIALGGDLNIIRTQQNGVFLSFYLNNAKKIEIASLAQGSSVIHLYSTHLKVLKLQLPSFSEQTKIANFLSAIDTKIDLVAKQLDEAKNFKKGLLQQMFV